MSQQQEIIRYKMTPMGLVPASDDERRKYNRLIATLSAGDDLTVHYEKVMPDSDPTYAYIKKVHATCRDIALYTGNDMDTIKLEIKERCGMVHKTKIPGQPVKLNIKSFSKCTRDELSLAIQEAINLGASIGLNLY